ncbi:MAG: DUF6553 family protein [Saccharofermentanales bacterium]|jgi:hypothetical protein
MEMNDRPDIADLSLDDALRSYRFFPLKYEEGKTGDIFLRPWIYCHVYASGHKGRGERKRASRELKRFFNERPLSAILKEAGDDAETLLAWHLDNSAEVYVRLCRDDDHFGRKLFGLLRMKTDERIDKIIRDTYLSMIPLLAMLSDVPERTSMIRALDRACRRTFPTRAEDIRSLVETHLDEATRSLLPAFDSSSEGSREAPSAR